MAAFVIYGKVDEKGRDLLEYLGADPEIYSDGILSMQDMCFLDVEHPAFRDLFFRVFGDYCIEGLIECLTVVANEWLILRRSNHPPEREMAIKACQRIPYLLTLFGEMDDDELGSRPDTPAVPLRVVK